MSRQQILPCVSGVTVSIAQRAGEGHGVENKEKQPYLTPQLIKIKCHTGQEKLMWYHTEDRIPERL